MPTSMVDFFEGRDFSHLYSQTRPSYSVIFDSIFEYCDQHSNGYNCALDIACGPGTSTFPLCEKFGSVIGIDSCQTVLEVAKETNIYENVKFYVANAEEMPFIANESVDLVTCAQAINFFDVPKLYNEVDRILKPNGAFIIYCYGRVGLDRAETADIPGLQFDYYRQKVSAKGAMDGSWPFMMDVWSGLHAPYPDSIRKEDLLLKKEVTIDEHLLFVSSYSVYNLFKELYPNENVLDAARIKLKEIYGDDDILASWPAFMICSRKPLI